MLFNLPDDDTLYRALLARDDRFDGQVYVCVATTGVFCRLTCPARKPKRENCTFQANPADCLTAGFRPCKRCHPLAPIAQADPSITRLLAALEADPDQRWSEGMVADMGFDTSTVRRAFQRHFGMTFLQLARQRRLRQGFSALSDGDRVITAQHAAGFDSPAAFREAFARLLGCVPGALSTDPILRADWIATPLGDMVAVASRTHLHLLEFVDRPALPAELRRLRTSVKGALGLGGTPPTIQLRDELAAFFNGESARFATPIHMAGSSFAQSVWAALRDIPAGETRSYSRLAQDLGRPEAVRAVARANGANQIALLVPCHRVIGADGSLTGYGGGLWRKQHLLEIEAVYQSEGRQT